MLSLNLLFIFLPKANSIRSTCMKKTMIRSMTLSILVSETVEEYRSMNLSNSIISKDSTRSIPSLLILRLHHVVHKHTRCDMLSYRPIILFVRVQQSEMDTLPARHVCCYNISTIGTLMYFIQRCFS